MVDSRIFREYVGSLNDNLTLGNATEHTHRPALKALLESIDSAVTATNEPARIECGAPDYSIAVDGLTIGYVEAKDIGVCLDAIERDSKRENPGTQNGDQLKRYRNALSNLILTNYTEFRWYVNGTRRIVSSLADDSGSGKLTAIYKGTSHTAELMRAFLERSPEPVSSPQELAQRMARLTHMIRDVVQEAFRIEKASPNVGDLYKASKEALVSDLSLDDFAEMFAQTLSYGLFAARVNANSGSFHWSNAAGDIPKANPFLRQVFDLTAGIDAVNEPFIGFVDDLSQLLANCDMAAVLSDFGKRGVREDPIMHFYETFLAAYDPELRERRGVYYTPEPVISYIVRSVDYLLRERFGCVDGLADHSVTNYETLEDVNGERIAITKTSHRVLVLDPACGTGSFLYAVIDHIREQYRSSDNAGMWEGYVRENLLPRIFGFELMMAPYAMAHLKLAMQLAAQDLPEKDRMNWAYDFDSDERLGVYLTNTLENTEQQAGGFFGPMRVITEEANAAAEIKREMPIMVVLGNPPYSGISSNRGEWITGLVDDYKMVDGESFGERRHWLYDDYVKFIRFGQWRIQQSGSGILAFITNHSFLDNPTFRGMRQQLRNTFTDIYLLDLHGNSRKRETPPDGSADQNVFDIQQGVAIAIFVKEMGKEGPAQVHHADLWGDRKDKYEFLSAADIVHTDWQVLEPVSPYYLFRNWEDELVEEYSQWQRVTDIMPKNSTGIITSRNDLTIRNTPDEVMSVVREFAALSSDAARRRFNLKEDGNSWRVSLAQDDLNNSGLNEDMVQPILFRSFDKRYTYYTGKTGGFLWRPRPEVMRHMLAGDNYGLITTRQTRDPWEALATDTIIAHKALAAYDISSLFPLYIYPSEQEIKQGLYAADHREPNLSPEFTENMERRLGLGFVHDGKGDLVKDFGPEDVFHYIYAMFHSPEYKERYDQFLRADFPRVPLTDDLNLFHTLVALGSQLRDVHFLRNAVPYSQPVNFPITGDNKVEKAHPKYTAPGETPEGETAPVERGRVYISKSRVRPVKQGQYFDGVSPDVWESRIGGYRPMEKWLKDRKGRTLSFDDITHYQRIAAALQETIRLTAEIDAAVVNSGMFG